MKVLYKKKFTKSYLKLTEKQKSQFKEKLRMFVDDYSQESLRNHALTGEYSGYRSINVSGDVRAIFRDVGNTEYEFVEFYNIGTHSQLYK